MLSWCGYGTLRALGRATSSGERAIAYRNDELFAVSERATYEESFEFAVRGGFTDPDHSVDNADCVGSRLFAFDLRGKTSRAPRTG